MSVQVSCEIGNWKYRTLAFTRQGQGQILKCNRLFRVRTRELEADTHCQLNLSSATSSLYFNATNHLRGLSFSWPYAVNSAHYLPVLVTIEHLCVHPLADLNDEFHGLDVV